MKNAKCIPSFLIPESTEWLNTRQTIFSYNTELWKEPTSLKSNLICTRQFVSRDSNPLKVGKLWENFNCLTFSCQSFTTLIRTSTAFQATAFSYRKAQQLLSQTQHQPMFQRAQACIKSAAWTLQTFTLRCSLHPLHPNSTDRAALLKRAPSNTDYIILTSGAVPRWGKTYREIHHKICS